jgi:hypothetical protein
MMMNRDELESVVDILADTLYALYELAGLEVPEELDPIVEPMRIYDAIRGKEFLK